jgi:hypothetical protein
VTDVIAELFDRLARRGHEPLLGKASGTLRLDLANGARTEHWLLTMRRGSVEVSRTKGDADCVAHVERALFERLVAGEANALAALLRGQIVLEGNPELLVMVQRLFPGPSGSQGRSEPAGSPRRSS